MVSKKKKEFNFYIFLRQGLRSLTRKFPPIYECLAKAKRPAPPDAPPRQKVVYECNICNGLFPAKQVSVDHILDAGSLLSKEDITPFIERLFCGADGLQVLCKTCHDAKSLSSKQGISFEDALVEKQVIAVLKDKQKTLDILAKHGYSGDAVSNQEKRRKLLRELLSNGIKEK